MKAASLRGYVYASSSSSSKNSLYQGDIISLDNEFRQLFLASYPKLPLPEHEKHYVMLLTQTCDMVNDNQRTIKTEYIVVCLVRKCYEYIQKLVVTNHQSTVADHIKLLDLNRYSMLKNKLTKLFNNSESKTHFFLPKRKPFSEDMVAVINMPLSFEKRHYNKLLKNKVLSLKTEFQAKIGYMLATLYGRVATPDLNNDESLANYVDACIEKMDVYKVPDQSFITYVKKHFTPNAVKSNAIVDQINQLIKDKQIEIREAMFKPERQQLTKKLRDSLFLLFRDEKGCAEISKMDDMQLRKKISNFIKCSDY